jgi:RNA polymerase sigma-70 factor (ECF subfamily)
MKWKLVYNAAVIPGMSVMSSSVSHSTSPSLIRRVQQQDQLAWQQLTRLYGPLVFHWCKRLGLTGADADDLFQEVFVAVARGIHRFEPRSISQTDRGNFRGWLWTITRNKAIDLHRVWKNREIAAGGSTAQLRLLELADPFGEESNDASDQIETASLCQRALEMIQAEFEPRTWQAFWRATVEQQPTATIAEDLQMSAASVRQAKSRVLRRLRQML